MVLRQHTLPKRKHLLEQHQRILVPPKCTVSGGKIRHFGA
jgi:hypothetical protein